LFALASVISQEALQLILIGTKSESFSKILKHVKNKILFPTKCVVHISRKKYRAIPRGLETFQPQKRGFYPNHAPRT